MSRTGALVAVEDQVRGAPHAGRYRTRTWSNHWTSGLPDDVGRTKLELERMAPGEELEVRCRAGEALENVPRSAREAGHAVSVEGTTIRIVRA